MATAGSTTPGSPLVKWRRYRRSAKGHQRHRERRALRSGVADQADASIAIHHGRRRTGQRLVRHDLAHHGPRRAEIGPTPRSPLAPSSKTAGITTSTAGAFTLKTSARREKDEGDHQQARPRPHRGLGPRPRDQTLRGPGEPYKVELIEAIPGDEPLRMYWHGDWQDLCRGPHLQHTGKCRATPSS